MPGWNSEFQSGLNHKPRKAHKMNKQKEPKIEKPPKVKEVPGTVVGKPGSGAPNVKARIAPKDRDKPAKPTK